MEITGSFLARLSCCAALVIAAMAQSSQAAQVCYDGGVIVDCTEPGYTEGGTWKESNNWTQTGQSWTPVHQTEQDGAWAKWTATLPTAGKYRVYFWHVPCGDSAAKIEIQYNGQSDALTRDVALGHMGWTSLGDYDFAAGENAAVKITHGVKVLMVNSVKFLPLANYKPLPPLPPYPKPDGSLPHIDARGNLLLSGQPYQVVYQELHEETTAHVELIPSNFDETFDIALAQGVNTLGTTIYWKTFEKTPGVYDYRILDALIEKARARNMHLSLILFFAWRNLQSYYLPNYVAADHHTYLFNHLADGTEDPHRKVSAFADATRAAETKALTALLRRVLEKDPDHQVVIMAQVENEMPSWRDYSPPAQTAWNGPVPQPLLDSLTTNEGVINRTVWRAWDKNGHKPAGTWVQVFGDDNVGNRIFGVWTAGCYIQQLVTDLKKVIDLPFYMNAWNYESPCAFIYMDVFHAATPVVNIMGPDAYGNFDTWETAVGLSVRSWNHLVIPEQSHTAEALWRAVGNYNALISGQWHAVEGIDWLESRETVDLYNQLSPLIAGKRGSGEMMGFFQSTHNAGESWSEYFNDLQLTYTAMVRPHLLVGKQKEPTKNEMINNVQLGELDGCGLLISLGEGEYLLTSTRLDITLAYINGGAITVADAQAGHFDNGVWITDGPANVEPLAQAVRFHFPTENRRYGQIRFKLTSHAANPARVFEAERGRILGSAEPIYNAAASGAFAVSNIKREGSGVEIATNLDFAANGLAIRYASKGPAKVSVSINGQSSQDIAFAATGADSTWATKTLPLAVPPGASVTIAAFPKSASPAIDCILLSRNAPAAAVPTTAP